MRASVLGLAAAGLFASAAPAIAQNTAPAPAFTLNGGGTVVSDYRFRGISQTDKRLAVQGTFTIGHESGLYATVWGSSNDDYIANGSDQEIDLIAGYKKTFNGTTIDGGFLYYYYPGSGGINSDFFKPYVWVSYGFGPVTGKLSAADAWKQNALTIGNGKKDNLYVAGDVSAGLGSSGLAVTGHLAQLRAELPDHRQGIDRLECRPDLHL